MTRIFTTLATIDATLLTSAFIVGTLSKLGVPVYMIHFWLGLLAALVTLLVHCLIFTYFLGTGRWVKEVAAAYRIADEPWPKLTRELKRWTFPPALCAMLIVIAAAAAGTGAQLGEWRWEVHAILAVLTLLVNAWAFRIEYRNVTINADVIEQVLAEVDRMRAERGLPSNQEALEQEGGVGR